MLCHFFLRIRHQAQETHMSNSQTLAIITNVLFVTQTPQHPCSIVKYLDANILRLTSSASGTVSRFWWMIRHRTPCCIALPTLLQGPRLSLKSTLSREWDSPSLPLVKCCSHPNKMKDFTIKPLLYALRLSPYRNCRYRPSVSLRGPPQGYICLYKRPPTGLAFGWLITILFHW